MKFLAILILCFSTSCAIEFQVSSQRTAIEEQILGAYQEMDEEVVLLSSVRALDAQGEKKNVKLNPLEQRAAQAKQNQQFNLDDLIEMKRNEILGENFNGNIQILPKDKGKVAAAKKEDLKLAEILVTEENKDRAVIWQRVIEKSPDLQKDNLDLVKENYRKQMFDSLESGMWYMNEKSEWVKKS